MGDSLLLARQPTASGIAEGLVAMAMLVWLIGLAAWSFFVAVACWAGARRGHPWLGLIAGLLAGPLGAVLACLVPDDSSGRVRHAHTWGARGTGRAAHRLEYPEELPQ